ncbi:MAG: Spy/CpxP family protein refolding chaperone [Acidobacteria bacterium]|nr:Spy/CpxP family protein refolding chaperone [Acidobacteriota bacterium]
MQSKRFFSILTLAIAALAFTTVSFAQETKTETTTDKAVKTERGDKRIGGEWKMGKRGKFGRHGKMRGVGLRGINLTDAQKEQFKALRQANRPSQAFRDEMKAIREAKRAGTITEDQKLRVKALRDEMRAKRKANHEQIMNILTVEQKAELETRRAEMKTRREEMRKRFQDRRNSKPAETAKPIS